MAGKGAYAILLAGGKGTRLWPLSTENYSKSFVSIGNRRPLVTETILRLGGLIDKKDIIIVVDKAQEKLLNRFTKGIPKKNILVEPFGRSTASAVGLAAIGLKPDDIMVVLPTDALIRDSSGFKQTMKEAINFTREKEGVLMCIGVRPKGPSTAYGYIKTKSRQKSRIYSMDRFIEKPKKQVAEKLAKSADYLWHAGIFVFKAKDILGAIRRHAPLLYRELSRIKKNRNNKKSAYSRMRNVSLDYQIMEKVKNLYCVKGNFSWRDLGSWRSLEELFSKDRHGNILFGKAALKDTQNSIIYNTGKSKLGVVGLRDTIVVHTENGTLVCGKKDAEKVKELVANL